MQERVINWILLAVLGIIILLLSAMPIFQGGREQRNYQKRGMRILAVSRARIMVLPALGIFVMGFLALFAYLAISDGAWEEAGGMILLCLGIGLLILIGGFFSGYCMQKRHTLYDDGQILLGAPFRPYRRLAWYEISRMEIKNQDAFFLYDRDGVKRVFATADLIGYHDFYETALRCCKPEYTAASVGGSAYQQTFGVISGAGMLRYRTGEYVVMLVISLLMAGMVFAAGLASGKDMTEMGAWLFSREGLETKLFVTGMVLISVISLLYTSMQKITYDTRQITLYRFPKGSESVNWKEVLKITSSVHRGDRIITLHTQKKNYTIREKQFRRGFSELVLELRKKSDEPKQDSQVM